MAEQAEATQEEVTQEAQDGEQLPDVDDDAASQNDASTEVEQEGEGEPAGADGEATAGVPTLDDDSPASNEASNAAPEWVKELRKRNEETARENRELKARLAAVEGAQTKPPELGAKPTLEGCDYDAEAFERKLEQWHETKRQHEAAKAEAERKAKAEQDAVQERHRQYEQAKSKLGLSDYAEAESAVSAALSQTQQSILLHGADKPELLVYALGKSPQKLAELAKIQDPVKYSFAVAKLETQMKVKGKTTAPPPPTKLRGNGAIGGTLDSTLARLKAEASKTGDYSKYHAAMREKSSKRAA